MRTRYSKKRNFKRGKRSFKKGRGKSLRTYKMSRGGIKL